MADVPHFRKYELTNDSSDSVIIPVIWLRAINGKPNSIVWEAPDMPRFHVQPGSSKIFDLSIVAPGKIPNYGIVLLGAGIVGLPAAQKPYDPSVELKYIITSKNRSSAVFKEDGTVRTEPPKNFVTELATTLEDPPVSAQTTTNSEDPPVLAKTSIAAIPNISTMTNAPNVAKLLISLANLISPDL